MSSFDSRNMLYPLGGGGGGGGNNLPLKAYMRQWLINLPVTDKLNVVRPSPARKRVNCVYNHIEGETLGLHFDQQKVVTNEGTASVEMVFDLLTEAWNIQVGVGTVSMLRIDGELVYPMQEGLADRNLSGVGEKGNKSCKFGTPNCKLSNYTWMYSDDITSANELNGHTNYIQFWGSDNCICRPSIGIGSGLFYIKWTGVVPSQATPLDSLFSSGAGFSGGKRLGVLVGETAVTATLNDSASWEDLSFPDYPHFDIPVELIFRRGADNIVSFESHPLNGTAPVIVQVESDLDCASDQRLTIGGGVNNETGTIVFPSFSKCMKFEAGTDVDNLVFDGVAVHEGMFDRIGNEVLRSNNEANQVDSLYIPALTDKTSSFLKFTPGESSGSLKDTIYSGDSIEFEYRFTEPGAKIGSAYMGIPDIVLSTYYGRWEGEFFDKAFTTNIASDFAWHVFKMTPTEFYIDGVVVATYQAHSATYQIPFSFGVLSAPMQPRTGGELRWVKLTHPDGETKMFSDYRNKFGKDWAFGDANMTFIVGAGGTEVLCARELDPKGMLLDAELNEITCQGGMLCNQSETQLTQHPDATQILNSVMMTMTNNGKTGSVPCLLEGEENGKPRFLFHYTGDEMIVGFVNSGVRWEFIDLATRHVLATNEANGLYPKKGEWVPVGSISAIGIDFDSNWIDDNGDLVPRDGANLISSEIFTGEEVVCKVPLNGGGCGIKEVLDYDQGAVALMTVEDKAILTTRASC